MIDECPYPQPTRETAASGEGYLYFVWWREAIRIARENGLSAPWTPDPVLQKYRFTNVRRRDDRMSKWFIENLIDPAVDCGDENLWFTLLVARLINWPPTIQALLDAGVIPCSPERFDPVLFSAVVESRKAAGLKVYGGAYMVYPTKLSPGAPKSESIATWILGDAVKRATVIRDTVFAREQRVEDMVYELSKCFGVSTFMAGQVVADLSYTPMGEDFMDLYSWAPKGPGSQLGLNILTGKPAGHSWAQKDFNEWLVFLNSRLMRHELGITDLTLHDVQNTACEYSKFARAILGTGKPKTLYLPETGY